MTNALLDPKPPSRLVLIKPKGIAVYEGRNRIAVAHGEYAYSPDEIEAMRTADLTLLETQV